MAHLTVISNRSQPDAIEVLVRAVSPEVALDGVNLEVAEAWSNLILNVNALIVTNGHGVATAIGSNSRPRTDDAVATGADAIDNIVGVVQAGSSQITVVRVCGRSRSRVAWVEVYVTQSIYVERDVSRCIHRDFWLRVVFDCDGLYVVSLVAEAVRSHPSTGQHTAAAGRVRSRCFSNKLDADKHIVSVSEAARVGVEASGTTVLAVIAIVREEHHFISSEVVEQPLVAHGAIQGDVISSRQIDWCSYIVAVNRLNVELSNVAELVERDVVELNKFAVLAIRSVVHGRIEGRDDVTGLTECRLTCNGTAPAEPA